MKETRREANTFSNNMKQGWFSFARNGAFKMPVGIDLIVSQCCYRVTWQGRYSGAMCGQTKVAIPRLRTWEYVKADIAEASPELPDGHYRLTFTSNCASQ